MGSGDERRRLLARDEFFEEHMLRFLDFSPGFDGRTRLVALGNSDDDVVAEEGSLGRYLRFLDAPTDDAGIYEVGAKVGTKVVALCGVGKGRRARRVVTVTAGVDDALDLAFFDGEKKSRSEDEQGTEESMA